MDENVREEVKLEGYDKKEDTHISSDDTCTVYLKEEDVKTEITEIKGEEIWSKKETVTLILNLKSYMPFSLIKKT